MSEAIAKHSVVCGPLTVVINKKNSMKTTVQLIAAIILCLFGLALMIVSFVMPPEGVIDSSVLVATGEVFTFSGALMGIDYKYRR